MYKQVICYRRDLKMRKGKIAAQCAHASLGVFLKRRLAVGRVAITAGEGSQEAWSELPADSTLVLALSEEMVSWATRGSKKVVLSVDDEEALFQVHTLAQAAGIPCSLIRDAGHTEFGGVPTFTAVAVGPAVEATIDEITGPSGAVKTKLA